MIVGLVTCLKRVYVLVIRRAGVEGTFIVPSHITSIDSILTFLNFEVKKRVIASGSGVDGDEPGFERMDLGNRVDIQISAKK